MADSVFMVDGAGRVVPVPAAEVEGAAIGGYAPASPEQIAEYQQALAFQERYGTPGQAAIAGLESAGSALTFGASTALERALGVPAEDIAAREEANPTAAGIGTAVGIAAPLVLTAGASAPASAAGAAAKGAARLTAPALAARAGRAVTGAVESALPQASSVAAQIASRAAAMGAGSAVEGAAYGLGQVVHEAALGDPHLTAQSALAEIGLTAALGGGLGALVGVAEVGLPAAARSTRDAIGNAFGRAKSRVEGWYAGAEKVHGVPKGTAELLVDHKLEIADLEKAAPGIIDTLSKAPPQTAASILGGADKFARLEREFPGIAKTLSRTRPDTLDLILGKADDFANLEREFPGTLRQLSAAEPSTAEYLRENWKLIIRDPAERARLAEGVRKGGQEIINSTDKMFKKAYGEMMKVGAPDLLADANPQAILASYGGIRQRVIQAIETMEARPSLFDPYYPAKLRTILDDLAKDTPGVTKAAAPAAPVESWADFTKARMGEYMKKYGGHGPAMKVLGEEFRALKDAASKATQAAADAASVEGVDAITAFRHLTRLRQEIGDKVSWGKSGLLPPAERDAQELVKGIYREVSDSLRSKEVFGAAGARKAELDEAFAAWKRITERRPGAQLGKSEKGTSNFNFLLMQSGALSPNKMNQWFNHLADDTGALKTQAWSEMMDAAKRAVDAVENLHKAAPVTAFDRGAVTSVIDKTAKATEDARQRFMVTQTKNALDPNAILRGSHPALAAAPAGEAASQAVGAAQAAARFTGPVSSTIKVALSPISSAVETAKHFPKGVAVLAGLERLGKSASRAIETGVSTLVRGSARGASVGRAETLAGVARSFGSDLDTATATFEKRVREIQSIAQDPDQLHRALLDQNGDLDEHAPETAQALSVASARAVLFLASKLPRAPQRGPLAPKWQPSQAEIAKFNRYYEAVQHPASILKQAAAGTLTREAVEAVATVYPELFGSIQAAIVDKLASHRGDVPYESKLMAGMILGQDLDGTVRLATKNRASFAGPSAKPSAAMPVVKPNATGLGRISISDRSLTPQQRAVQR
jgi:hypothetical protein